MSKNETLRQLDIIVPVKNEADALPELIRRLDKTLAEYRFKGKSIKYTIFIVDDYSTDNTVQVAKELSLKHSINLVKRVGQPGKAFAILEAVEQTSSDCIAVMDGDLQYPPEVMSKMLDQACDHGVVIARRVFKDHTPLHQLIDTSGRFLLAKLLFGEDHDIQSGLKVFKREIISHIEPADVSEWTLDIPLLHTALELGHSIKEVDVEYRNRKKGKNKISVWGKLRRIGWWALGFKVKSKRPLKIRDTKSQGMTGDGLVYKKSHFITHTDLDHYQLAIETFSLFQKTILLGILLIAIAGLVFFTLPAAKIIVAVLSVIYFVDVLFNLFLILRSLHSPPEIQISDEELAKLKDSQLPVYSILCPLYKEAHILPQFLESIDKIEWPKNKLDVQLLLEEDDQETIEVAKKMDLPKYVRITVVPHSQPKTKPKACNYGLNIARGEYLVIYDAEDKPDPQQLKKVYAAFQTQPENVKCIQAKLNYYNPHQNLLTRFFTAEYSLWFDVVLTGLQTIETTIPLGGTSNHFRTKDLMALRGWDPFNVTEDCDLGVRLFREGARTAVIDSITLEEANSDLKNWMRQRSRWVKGYMQTYLLHMRNPVQLIRTHKWHALAFQLTVGGKIAFLLINPLMWVLTISYFVLYAQVGAAIEALYPSLIFYMAVSSLVFGNFMFIFYYMIGVAKREHWTLMKFVLLIPVYWLMTSVAAGIALYQLIVKPHYWEKTVHGLHLKKEELPKEREGSFRNNIYALVNLLKGNGFSPKKKIHRDTLRVLIFNWRDTKHVWAGGAEAYIHELAKQLGKMNIKVTVFCGNDGANPRNEVVDGVQIVRRGGFYTVYIWAFLYYVLRFRGLFDVVIDSENGVPFFTPLFVKKPIILLIHHVHQNVFRTYLSFPLSHIALFAESVMMPWAYRNSEIVTVSESSKADIKSIGLGKRQKIKVAFPGVRIEKTDDKKTKNPTVLYLGRLKDYKCVDVLIRAVANVKKDIPNVELIIAGEGEAKFGLERLVSTLKIKDNVKFLGRVSQQKKAKLFTQSWVAVQPSIIEGWGITIIEANACGTPVVASNVNGLRESVVDGKTGKLVPARNVTAFAESIKELLKSPGLRRKYSRNAQEWAKGFRWEESAQIYIEGFRKQIESQSKFSFKKAIFEIES